LRQNVKIQDATPKSPTPKSPRADFLPPPVEIDADGDSEFMRAVVFVSEETKKGTSRAGQEYQEPLLVLTGREYAAIKFDELHTRICDALRGRGPGAVAQSFPPDGGIQLILSDRRVIIREDHNDKDWNAPR